MFHSYVKLLEGMGHPLGSGISHLQTSYHVLICCILLSHFSAPYAQWNTPQAMFLVFHPSEVIESTLSSVFHKPLLVDDEKPGTIPMLPFSAVENYDHPSTRNPVANQDYMEWQRHFAENALVKLLMSVI